MAGNLAVSTLTQALRSELLMIPEFVPRRIGGNTRPLPSLPPLRRGREGAEWWSLCHKPQQSHTRSLLGGTPRLPRGMACLESPMDTASQANPAPQLILI